MTPPAAAAAAQAPPATRRRSAPPRPGRIPRRVSGPARGLERAPALRAAPRAGSAALQLLALIERLAEHRLLDRLIRGRTWIGLVAFALIGIVTLQLALLKLNGSIGSALERAASLQRENAALSIQNSELASTSRVQAQGVQLGMIFARPSALQFLTASGSSRSTLAGGAAALAAPAHSASSGSSEEASSSEASSSESPRGEAPSGESSSSEASSSEASRSSEASSSEAASNSSSEAASHETTEASSSEASSGGASAEAPHG